MKAFFAICLVLSLSTLVPFKASADGDKVQYDSPILFKLSYKKFTKPNDVVDEEDSWIELPVLSRPRTYIPSPAIRVHDKWRIVPGESLYSYRRPRNREVLLYKGKNRRNRILICKVEIRYFRDREEKTKWNPFFRLNQEHLAVFRNGRVVPISGVAGNPTFVIIVGNTLPNTHGYYPKIVFGLTNQRTQIDSWVVK